MGCSYIALFSSFKHSHPFIHWWKELPNMVRHAHQQLTFIVKATWAPAQWPIDMGTSAAVEWNHRLKDEPSLRWSTVAPLRRFETPFPSVGRSQLYKLHTLLYRCIVKTKMKNRSEVSVLIQKGVKFRSVKHLLSRYTVSDVSGCNRCLTSCQVCCAKLPPRCT